VIELWFFVAEPHYCIVDRNFGGDPSICFIFFQHGGGEGALIKFECFSAIVDNEERDDGRGNGCFHRAKLVKGPFDTGVEF